MAAGITDQLTKASTGTRPVPTTLSSTKAVAAASISCVALTAWPTTTAVHFIIYTVNTAGQKVAGSQTDWKGIVSGTSITNLTLKAGTDNGYAIGAVVEAAPTAAWADDLYAWGIAHANQDGTLKTSAVQAALNTATAGTDGWTVLATAPTTITHLGNRSYTALYPLVDYTDRLTVGARLKLTRTVAAPSQSTSLNGTTQYYSKAAPSGMTFTDDFVCEAWVKMSAFGNDTIIISRSDGTSGWWFGVNTYGNVILNGHNAAAGNYRRVVSYQALPLNTWVHISALLDMSANTAAAATAETAKSWIMFNGVEVPALAQVAGTSPSALVQAGSLNVGALNGANFFSGKIAQVAVYSTRVTQAVIRASMNQTLSGSETSLISAYSFNNVITDLNTGTANNLTANGAAVATNADSPFTQAATAGLYEYGIIEAVTFSTNTTVTVQIPEGSALPTTGGITASSYSTDRVPYGFPAQKGKWRLELILNTYSSTSFSAATWTIANGPLTFTVPIGQWEFGFRGPVERQDTVAGSCDLRIGLTTSTPNPTDYNLVASITNTAANTYTGGTMWAQTSLSLSSATQYTLINYIEVGTSVTAWFPSLAAKGYFRIYAENALL